MSELTLEEKALVTKLRQRVGNILTSEEQKGDLYLVRWVRAREGNLDKAETMLKSSLEWRKQNKLDEVLQKPIDPWMKENFKYWIEGRDKGGRPVLEMLLGSWDIRKAMDAGKEDAFILFVNQYFERLMQRIRESNRDRSPGQSEITQFTAVVNWKGYSYGQLVHWKALQSTMKLCSTYEAHYPEVLFKCYYINCPAVFSKLLDMMKSVLAPKTIHKIQCFGTNREEWEPEIRKLIAPDQLGCDYGGQCTRQ